MKPNVFSEELPDGSHRVFSPDIGVEGHGEILSFACNDFVRNLRLAGFCNVSLQAADEEVTNP